MTSAKLEQLHIARAIGILCERGDAQVAMKRKCATREECESLVQELAFTGKSLLEAVEEAVRLKFPSYMTDHAYSVHRAILGAMRMLEGK